MIQKLGKEGQRPLLAWSVGMSGGDAGREGGREGGRRGVVVCGERAGEQSRGSGTLRISASSPLRFAYPFPSQLPTHTAGSEANWWVHHKSKRQDGKKALEIFADCYHVLASHEIAQRRRRRSCKYRGPLKNRGTDGRPMVLIHRPFNSPCSLTSPLWQRQRQQRR